MTGHEALTAMGLIPHKAYLCARVV